MDKNIKIIYKILKTLEVAMDYDEFDLEQISADVLKISENRWSKIMEMLCQNGFVQGVSVKYVGDGDVLVSVNSPRVTLKGLEYLNENSLMKRAHNAAKGIKDVLPGV